MKEITLTCGLTFQPCSAFEWDNLSESNREVIDFKQGQGFELAGEKRCINSNSV